MSLVDRFSSMRAGGGLNTSDATATASDILIGKTAYAGGQKITGILDPGEYGDLKMIGTTVTAQAVSAIPKGGKWRGILNSTPHLISGTQYMPATTALKTSEDLVVGYTNQVWGATTTTAYVRFFNNSTSTYDPYPVDVTSAIQALALDSNTSYTSVFRMNTDGSLIVIAICNINSATSVSGETCKWKLITIEVDRENKTGTAYVTTLEEESTAYAWVFLVNDYFFRKTQTGMVALYKYNWETHSFDLLSNDNASNSIWVWGYNNPTSLAIIDDTTFLITFPSNLVFKLIINSQLNTVTTTYVIVPTFTGSSYTPSPTVSPNGQYVVATSRISGSAYRANLYSLNYQDMTISILADPFLSKTDDIGLTYISDNVIWTNFGVYEYDGSTCNKIWNNSIPYYYSSATPIFNHRLFYLSYNGSSNPNDTVGYRGYVTNTDAEYLITYDGTTQVETHKAYGITNKAMGAGDSNTAQLLWSDVGGPIYYPIKLEYIESTGTQYIDTGITFTDQHKIEIKFQFVSTSNYPVIFGLRAEVNNTLARSIMISSYNSGWTAWGSQEGSLGYNIGNTNIHTITINGNKWYAGTSLIKTFSTETFQTPGSAYLFCFRNYGHGTTTSSPANLGNMRIYYCKIYDANGDLVRNLVPTKDDNNVVCFYDYVTEAYLYNAGTGDFVAGNPVI